MVKRNTTIPIKIFKETAITPTIDKIIELKAHIFPIKSVFSVFLISAALFFVSERARGLREHVGHK